MAAFAFRQLGNLRCLDNQIMNNDIMNSFSLQLDLYLCLYLYLPLPLPLCYPFLSLKRIRCPPNFPLSLPSVPGGSFGSMQQVRAQERGLAQPTLQDTLGDWMLLEQIQKAGFNEPLRWNSHMLAARHRRARLWKVGYEGLKQGCQICVRLTAASCCVLYKFSLRLILLLALPAILYSSGPHSNHSCQNHRCPNREAKVKGLVAVSMTEEAMSTCSESPSFLDGEVKEQGKGRSGAAAGPRRDWRKLEAVGLGRGSHNWISNWEIRSCCDPITCP